jgi:hypothetical protein
MIKSETEAFMTILSNDHLENVLSKENVSCFARVASMLDCFLSYKFEILLLSNNDHTEFLSQREAQKKLTNSMESTNDNRSFATSRSSKTRGSAPSSPISTKGFCNVAMNKEWPRIEQSGSFDYDSFRWSMQNLEKIMGCMEHGSGHTFEPKK